LLISSTYVGHSNYLEIISPSYSLSLSHTHTHTRTHAHTQRSRGEATQLSHPKVYSSPADKER